MWISSEIALKHLHSFQNNNISEITNSDHTLLKTQFLSQGLFSKQPCQQTPKSNKKRILDIKNTSDLQWLEYQNSTTHKFRVTNIQNRITQLYLNDSLNNIQIQDEIDRIWSALEQILFKTALNKLASHKQPNGIRPTKLKAYKSEFKKYRKALKILRLVKTSANSQNLNNLNKINELIDLFNRNNNL